MKNPLAGLLLSPVLLLSAAEYFCSPSGSDSAAGTKNAPWKTPAAAAAKVKSGDVITLLPGIYPGDIVMKTDGVTLRGTRGKDGEYLSLIDSGKELKNWQPEPEIGEEIWSVPMRKEPGCVTVNGRQIILLGRRLMSLKPQKMRPEKVLGKHYSFGSGGKKQRTKNMLPGLDLMALPKGTHIVSGQFGSVGSLDLWTISGGMMSGWREGKLYLRLLDGRKPSEFTFRAGSGRGIVIKDISGTCIEDLKINTVKIGIEISGKKAKDNIVRRCRIEHGIKRILVTDGASDNKILDNILSLGFVCPKYFSSVNWKYNRLVYITFKYLVSNRQVSEDHSLVFDNSGPGNLAEGNVVYQGLCGTEANFSQGVTVRNNVFRELSSVGIVCCKGSKMEIAGNVMINNGINLRLHSFRWVPQGRTAYIHDNILYYTEGWGMQLFTLCTTAHPEAPEDVWFYHNTLVNSNYFMNASSFLRNYKDVPQPISIVNNLLVLDPNWKFKAPALRLVAGNASSGECSAPDKWGKANAFKVPVEGEKPFLKAKDVPETKGKTVALQNPSEVQGVSIPALPGMKDHSPLPGAQWDPKMVELVSRSNELSVQAIDAMKSK
ncbi:MAG: hypothetical protein E7055_08265 [Lentisphaerae bacterium]|nr:hypothetical protein [Lentisphaerota bacterium]